MIEYIPYQIFYPKNKSEEKALVFIMKQSIAIFFFIMAFGAQNSLGCINYYHTVDQVGEMHSWGEEGFVHLNKNFNLELIASKLPKLAADFQKYHSA